MAKYDAFDPGAMNNFYGTIVSISPEAAVSLGSMEGMVDTAVLEPPATSPIESFVASPWFGYVAAGTVTLLAYAMSHLPYMPSLAMLAIILGVVVRNVAPIPGTVSLGCKKIVRSLIPVAIVFTGAGLSFAELGKVGFTAGAITLGCVAVALAGTYWIARALGLTHKTATLLGIGTGICGSSAIVAAAPLVEADDEDMVLSIGAVNLFGLLVMLALPAIGAAMALDAAAFGVWAGTTIHAVPQVLAAATGYDPAGDALQIATLVKLGRVAMLAPVVFVLAVMTAQARATAGRRRIHYARLVPWFVWGFIVMALLNTMALLPQIHFAELNWTFDLDHVLDKNIGKLLLTVAMAAIGLEVRLKSLLSVGGKAVLAGLISSLLLAAASLVMILAMI